MMLRVLFRASKSSQTHRKLCSVHMDPKAELKLYRPPAEVRGMTDLNREAFTQSITVPALRVPLKVLNKVVKSLKSVMIQRPGLTRVVPEEGSSDSRLVLLDPQKVTSASSFSGPEEEALRAFSVAQELQDYELTLGYENLKSEEVLEAVLPPGQDVTSGFSRVGHIAHMNLRDHQLPYRNLIGQVIIDKNPGVTCVVNKTNSIDSTYRNFKMEVMAGEENMVAKVKENGAAYEFDFSRVYWNPRLSTEHQRIVQQVARGDTVFDVFAGVGPFAVPAARCGATVYANDLNPESFRWLKHNCKLNKVETRVRTFNMDGRAFIRGAVRDELPALLKHKATVHVVMNLPALAIDFLDAFQGLLQDEPPPDAPLPTVHCYGFSKEEDAARDVTQRASDAVGVSLENRSTVHFVRNVAPNKDMLCVSFRVPREVLYSSESTAAGEGHDTPARSTRDQSEPGLFLSESADQPASKRQKCEDPAQTT